MTSRRQERNEQVRATYEKLAQTGVITDEFEHGGMQIGLFVLVMEDELRRMAVRENPAILDAGCGGGAWIETLSVLADARLPHASWYGFDLAPAMIRVAEKRLSDKLDRIRLGIGDVLDDTAYDLRHGGTYELVYAYDVVQQLPRTEQAAAVETLLRHVAPGGSLVVFDHDAHSLYGFLMAAAKKLTRLGIPLLPSYYTAARYPKLAQIRASLAARPRLEATIVRAADRRKRALIVHVLPDEGDR